MSGGVSFLHYIHENPEATSEVEVRVCLMIIGRGDCLCCRAKVVDCPEQEGDKLPRLGLIT